jgi:hypothetical protein
MEACKNIKIAAKAKIKLIYFPAYHKSGKEREGRNQRAMHINRESEGNNHDDYHVSAMKRQEASVYKTATERNQNLIIK